MDIVRGGSDQNKVVWGLKVGHVVAMSLTMVMSG